MNPLDPRPYLADAMFGAMRLQTAVYNRFNLPVISTGRPFKFYRDVFFDGASERDVLAELHGKTVVDVGCGLTPFVSDSAFQVCNANEINFYGVDPKLGGQFKFGAFDRLKVRMTGGQGEFNPQAPFRERMLATYADQIPLADGSVDMILSSWLLSVWISDEAILAKIFDEFFRLLKPGGQVRLYPQPLWCPERLQSDTLRQALGRFQIGQLFRISRVAVQWTPAYTRVLQK